MAVATTEVTVHLVLTKQEALILKLLVQNPIQPVKSLEDEPIEYREWRKALWEALPPQSDLY